LTDCKQTNVHIYRNSEYDQNRNPEMTLDLIF
jgi:hypothetical protein